jgi:hypothetical protein
VKIKNNPTIYHFSILGSFYLCLFKTQRNLNSSNNKTQKRDNFRILIISSFFEDKHLKKYQLELIKQQSHQGSADGLR